MVSTGFRLRRLLTCLGGLLAVSLSGAPLEFNLPAQPAAQSLLAFSQQAHVEVLFSFDELSVVTAPALAGKYEPEDALNHLLKNTGFAARRNLLGKFVVTRSKHPTGSLEGHLLSPGGEALPGIPVALSGTRLRTATDGHGAFSLPAVPPGDYRLLAGSSAYRLLDQPAVHVTAGETSRLAPLQLQAISEITEFDPYQVMDERDRLLIGQGIGAPPRRAAGNLDLPRTEDNALPFTIYTGEQITRSGVVQLNEFFQRELLNGDSSAPPPEQNGQEASYVSGSSNLNLRGYNDETVVLINGRRMPETITVTTGQLGTPDVNLIPLAMVQQVQVLPVSASALYSGNAVGGVINIVLRPDTEGTEVRTTYTNALGGFDAPQSSLSLQHGHFFLGGKLRLLLNATFTRTEPAVDTELGYQRARLAGAPAGLLPRGTPNIGSADGTPLFGPGTAAFTSVAPGADGTGGLPAYAGRQGMYSTALFDTPGGLASSINSQDFPYGREQRRAAYYGSVVYDVLSWLQLGLDATYAQTVVHRGYDLFAGNLSLSTASPFNPFHQDLHVALNEFAPRLGPDYSEARLDTWSLVAGALLKLPREWRLSLDAQYARNTADYRGLYRADAGRWQELVDAGGYNPLRDTQVHAPPAAFYDRVLVYYRGPGRFVRLGDYETIEATARVTNEALKFPTGEGTINFGTDYRSGHLAPYLEEHRFADGTPADEIIPWSGRTLERISVFGEIQAPLVSKAHRPHWLKNIETDLAARYILSTQSNETNFAPTFGLKLDLAGGFALRGSLTTSNRFPNPAMSRRLGNGGGGSNADLVPITDPLRHEQYEVESRVVINPDIRPEEALTQTAGLVYQRGQTHHFRVALDFADTTKTNEIVTLLPQTVVDLESVYPDRVIRTTPAPASPPLRVTTLLTGPVNMSHRHSQNWNATFDYTWNGFAGGMLELRVRWAWFQRYDMQVDPTSPVVDELNHPDGHAPGLLRNRLSFSAGWSRRDYGFGVDSHYLSDRILPEAEWEGQGSDRIKSYWQFDAYVQSDLTRFLPRKSEKFRLNAQLRLNNLSGFGFPKYVNDVSGSGVQPYGDWRGRTYSLTLTASF